MFPLVYTQFVDRWKSHVTSFKCADYRVGAIMSPDVSFQVVCRGEMLAAALTRTL